MRPTVYIDGKGGTTGLQLYDRLAGREDIRLLLIDEDKRKDPEERRKYLNGADLVFLCLPDGAAREAVALVTNDRTRIIDASTAHRTAPGWVYGFPELSRGHRAAIAAAKRVANPGCHATGFISIVYPLVAAGVLSPAAALSCFSLTGYSGGGKKMIAQYQGDSKGESLYSPGIYALGQSHKHLPEMQAVCGLTKAPVFTPIVDDYDKGMATTVPLHREMLQGVFTLQDLRQILAEHYAGEKLVHVAAEEEIPATLYANRMAGREGLTLWVCGSGEAFTVTALFDNLGKGASGAAVQNMNLMLGFDETAGLE